MKINVEQSRKAECYPLFTRIMEAHPFAVGRPVQVWTEWNVKAAPRSSLCSGLVGSSRLVRPSSELGLCRVSGDARTHADTHTHTRTYTHVHRYTYTHVHTHTHMYTHPYTHNEKILASMCLHHKSIHHTYWQRDTRIYQQEKEVSTVDSN